MRAVVQRVTRAAVRVGEETVGSIERGLLVLVGIAGDDTDDDAAEVIAGMDELGALRLQGDPGRLAQLAVVVTGAREQADARAAVGALVRALDAGGQGAVVTGPGVAAPAVAWARAGGEGGAGGGSSVDSGETTAGRVAVVLALVEQLAGKQGAYGVGPGATGVLPASVLGAGATG